MRAALPEALEAGGAVESLCHGLAATGALLELLRGQRRRVFHAVGGTPCGDETTRRNGAVSGVTALEDNGGRGGLRNAQGTMGRGGRENEKFPHLCPVPSDQDPMVSVAVSIVST